MTAREGDPFPVRDVWRLDTRRLGRRVIVYARTDSTNTRALLHAGEPDSEGLVILADDQTAGRGQHGRTWSAAPRSSVLLSVLVHPPTHLARPVILTAWAAVSVCAVVQQLTGAEPRIKWPNDVLLRGKKVCGILIEQSRQGEAVAAVVGIGVNVTQSEAEFTAAGLPLATSLAAAGIGIPDTDAVATILLRQLDDEYDRLIGGDLDPLEVCWRQRLGQMGQEVVLECIHGMYAGRLLDVGFAGVVIERAGLPLVVQPETVLHIHTAE